MTSSQDQDFGNYMKMVYTQLQNIFSYSVPWFGLAVSTFALIALMKPRRREQGKNLLIYIFKWRYWIAIFYWLNMIFIDYQFSYILFNYNIRLNVSDPICKFSSVFMRFFYFVSPWMEVVILFYIFF
jgi:hypothetical protein